MMRVIYELPPMFGEIDAKFHIANKPVLFSWGDIIYNPMRVNIPPCLNVQHAEQLRKLLKAAA